MNKRQITVQELKEKLDKKTVTLIDVREEFELKIAKISGCVSIPLQQIPKRLSEFNFDTKYAVICHTGLRSEIATNYLINNGYSAHNVHGGIDCWAKSIDKDMSLY